MTAQYKYDPFGRRIEKNINGTITRYLYDNEDILFELDTNNNIIAGYIHGPGIDEPIATTNGTSHYYHTDGLGSIIAITDSAGNVVQSYEYDSFGNITYQQDPNYIQPYTYTAREYDPESGLYYYRARYYDPQIGRFFSEDPVDFLGGINFYVYVINNPINWIDPFGLQFGGLAGWGARLKFDPRPENLYPLSAPFDFTSCWVDCMLPWAPIYHGGLEAGKHGHRAGAKWLGRVAVNAAKLGSKLFPALGWGLTVSEGVTCVLRCRKCL